MSLDFFTDLKEKEIRLIVFKCEARILRKLVFESYPLKEN